MFRTERIVALVLILGSLRPAEADPVTLNQSVSQAIVAGNSIACSSGPDATAETSYYRRFHLADFGITQPFAVSSVSLGIETAAGGADQAQPLIIRLYDSGDLASLGASVATFSTIISDQSLTHVTVPIGATVVSGDLIVEVSSPDGTSAGESFRIGSNSAPQTAPSYIRAPHCGIAAPADLAILGAENMHILLSVTGTLNATGVTCEVQLSQPIYMNDDTVGVSNLRIKNVTSAAVPAEIKIWLGISGIQLLSLANIGADGSVVLPPSLEAAGPLDLFQVTPTFPRGTYELGCRILDPTTGATLSASISSSVIQ